MKLLTLFSMICICALLAGCPKKKAEGDAPADAVEGASTSDKSGEGSSDEMQEKKGGSAEPAAEPAAEDKK